MVLPTIQPSFAAGELSPSLYGRVDLPKWHQAATTMRNFFVNYRGGASSRAGTAYVGMCKQGAPNTGGTSTANPPRDIKFQFSQNQAYALEFGDQYMRVKFQGAYITEDTYPITGATRANPAVISATGWGVSSFSFVGGNPTGSYAPGDQVTLGQYTPGQPTYDGTALAVIQVTTTGIGNNGINVSAGGIDYNVNDTITLAGGTHSVAAILTVVTVHSGAVTSVSVSTPGVYSINPANASFTQASSSGSGTGATFNQAVMIPVAATVVSPGSYTSDPGFAIQVSTTGTGAFGPNGSSAYATGLFNLNGTTPNQIYNNGDWVYISGVGGMTQLNGHTFIVTNSSSTGFHLTDLFGNVIDSSAYTAYTSGGTVARILTVAAPYAAIDAPWIKFTQSADTMSLGCVNQDTGTEYPPYDLVRNTNVQWAFTQTTFGSSIAAPTGCAVTAQNSTTVSTWYGYVVTAVSAATGEESVASNAATVENNDISVNAGSNTITWNAVLGASSYNVYAATPAFGSAVAAGVSYGFIGTAFGTSFTDTNIVADFTTVPPLHSNPFARNAISAVPVVNAGLGLTQPTIGYTVNTSTGTGFVGQPIIVGGLLAAFLVVNGGQNYAPGVDTITMTTSAGVAPSVRLVFGAATGTYPGSVAYFQQRRTYANSLNDPDTFWMSQPGAFTNMDASIPSVDSDAIIATPWSLQVNGIQHMLMMPSGLVVLTGSGAWQIEGANGSAITPSNVAAAPQAYNGINALVPPIPINYDILYLQSKGSIYRDLAYNFFVNIYTGTDMTVLSNHLFQGFTFSQHAWCEEPFKVLWTVRNDGTMLSFTYLKEQDVYAWARHDTNGLIQGVCSVTEPPVDALYLIVQRLVNGVWVYYAERMNNRLWTAAENVWCVDCGLQYAMPTPNATISASATSGNVTFTASSAVFSAGNVGSILRMGNGIGVVITYNSATSIVATMTQDITATVPNDPNNTVIPAIPGAWSLTVPVTTLSGINHLNGLLVSILADGNVVPQQIVTNGSITLPVAASSIIIGLPFTAQLQTLYLDVNQQQATAQGRFKTIAAVTVRLEASRGVQVGSNQPDAAAQPYGAPAAWGVAPLTPMTEWKQRSAAVPGGQPVQLYTGDARVGITTDWKTGGQVAVQQVYPLPCNVLAVMPEWNLGSTPG